MRHFKLLGIAGTGALLLNGCQQQSPENEPTNIENDNPKNLIVIKMDEARWDQLGYMGHPVVKTPNIDKLAEKSHVFVNNYTVSPLCTPSRASFFTGKYTMQHGCKFVDMPNHMKPDQWSYIKTLDDAGYVIGLAGKNHCFNDEYMEKYFDFREEYSHFGKLHGTFKKKDQEIYDYRHDEKRPDFQPSVPDHEGVILSEGLIEGPMPFEEEEAMTYRIAEDGINFLETYKDDKFFLHYSFPDPHWPNVVPEPYYSMYNPDSLELEAMDVNWSEHPFAHYVQSQSQGYDDYTEWERKRILATMYGQITFIDKSIGMLMDKLEELDLMDKTVIVFTVDHGNFGGRFGLIGKTKAFYDALVRVPLTIYIPEIEGNGKRYQAQLENIDVMPTMMEYLGFEKQVGIKGVSFLPIMKGESPDKHRDVIYSEVGLLDRPPGIMSVDEFKAFQKKRIEESGTTWFLDYTVNGRASMIKKDNWKYCFYVNDREELYNLEEDPMEIHNLAYNEEYASKKEEMKNLWMEQVMIKSMTEITE
jgi:arylsulfatase A-like enzyme